ncbi:uncharacterized protein LOC127806236 isoform X2 [Diospyros lotus]|nr:uncharacterized protein LOC127806236 isoform X2 [Diospyros lotus]XP_052199369.1 uncharacterized protein LOC127806236 isoform X2 [Diospyros lotus]XP_052199380.1 uncharacterized protein LOC127806236 isoform X2 [Diospyros lotus]XP_052199390.1 uncharacterized protein LOC127806236 isoform X2 [Diospyros lotus]XP_052199395.1 uncharacterized protein LOC127806236 isoform X2 [Diospyros lotus]XP_052199400.1 uncharacterized protein LOC127806236 isoform X2 [Diospyros lotus]XP_052199407.1 uncharacterize
MIIRVTAAVIGGLVGWAYLAMKPPPPKICGSQGGPPVTSPRVQLSDGRHLAYKEKGVPMEEAKYKIIIIHGFDSSKDLDLPVSQELIEELRIYFLLFDRAGYGESDPNPKRSVKSEAFDIQELADKLNIGSKFYLIGVSMGAYPIWSCLKYIPHRLSGASLVVPMVNYWWPCLPPSVSKQGFKRLLAQDQWSFRVAHYTPWLFYWWMTQKWFPSLSIMTGNMAIFCKQDLEMIKMLSDGPSVGQFVIGAMASKKDSYKIEKFDGSNFRFCKMQMKDYLYQQDLYLPLDEKPRTIKDEEWKVSNRKALGAVHPSLMRSNAFNVKDQYTIAGLIKLSPICTRNLLQPTRKRYGNKVFTSRCIETFWLAMANGNLTPWT